MERLVRTGLSAIAAFALVMALTLTARATENAVVTAKENVVIDKIELTTSIEAQTLSVTVEKLIAKWAMDKALRRPEEVVVMKEPRDGIAPSVVAQANYYFNVAISQEVGEGDCNLSNSTVEPFTTDEEGDPMPPTTSPGTECAPNTDYCCVLAFARTDIEHIQTSPGVWVWRPIAGRTPVSYEKRADNPAK